MSAYQSSESDPFEYTYNGKILTKPYVEEIDRLLRNGHSEKDECVLKLIKKLTWVINPNATELVPMSTINFARNTLKAKPELKRYLFTKQEKDQIYLMSQIIPQYKRMNKELTDEMKIVDKAFDSNGNFNIDLIDMDQYYLYKFNKNK
jgi:hypothetical protein